MQDTTTHDDAHAPRRIVDIRRIPIEDSPFMEYIAFPALYFSPLIKTLLAHGGIVAGGFPRFIAKSRCQGKFHDYFARGGDIDIFFPDKFAYECTRNDMCAYTNLTPLDNDVDAVGPSLWTYKVGCGRSRAGFAFNYTVPEQTVDIGVSLGSRFRDYDIVNIQLVDITFGEPVDMLRSFDFLNSMIGFDSQHAYIAAGWEDNEDANTLDIVNCTNAYMFTRIWKYIVKYEYSIVTHDSVPQIMRALDFIECDDFDVGELKTGTDRSWTKSEFVKFVIDSFVIHKHIDVEKLINMAGLLVKPETFMRYGESFSLQSDPIIKSINARIENNDLRPEAYTRAVAVARKRWHEYTQTHSLPQFGFNAIAKHV